MEPERDRENLDHRSRYPAEDDEVDRQRQVEGAESTQGGGGYAAVANLREFDIRHYVGSSPQPGEEEHGEHAAHQHVPPDPVCGDAVIVDEAGDDEGGIGRESCRYHGGAGEPPRHVASRDEVLAQTLASALRESEAYRGREEEVSSDNSPVDRSECHSSWIGRWPGKTFAFRTVRSRPNLQRRKRVSFGTRQQDQLTGQQRMTRNFRLLAALPAICGGCVVMSKQIDPTAELAEAKVRPGISVLLSDSIDLIRGRRVGLLTNQTC